MPTSIPMVTAILWPDRPTRLAEISGRQVLSNKTIRYALPAQSNFFHAYETESAGLAIAVASLRVTWRDQS